MIKKLFCVVLVLMTNIACSSDKGKEPIDIKKDMEALKAELRAKTERNPGVDYYAPVLKALSAPYDPCASPEQVIIEVGPEFDFDHNPVVISKEDREKIEKMTVRIDAMFGLDKHDKSKDSDESKTRKEDPSSENSDAFKWN